MTAAIRVVVADDQDLVRSGLEMVLTARGLDVVALAADGREALEMFRAKADHPYDLVITDKAMPHMNGEQLAAAIKAMSPDTRVIMLTGYGASADGTMLPANIDMVVDKPVTRQALREAIARVMADSPNTVPMVEALAAH